MKSFETGFETKSENGKNVEVMLVYLRHGHRGLSGDLTDLGRDETAEIARELNLGEQYDMVKPYGSKAGPLKKIETESVVGEKELNMGRSMETSLIFAQNSLAPGQEMYNPKPIDSVNYEKYKSTRPYDHIAIYNSFIPSDYNDLPDEKKVMAAKYAQKKTIEHLMSLNSAEAQEYKKEVAGGYALPLVHFAKMSERLKSNQKILAPLGAHGGHLELLLQQAMVRNDSRGNRIVGFENLDEIGGEIDPSEGFSVQIKRDENGKLQDYVLTFFNQEKRPAGEFVLDASKIREVSEFYEELHREDLSLLNNMEVKKKENEEK